MRCRKIRRWLSAQLDGELSPARRLRLERHLARCPRCAQYRHALAASEERTRALAFPGTSPDFYAQTRRKLAQEPEPLRTPAVVRPGWTLGWVPRAALLVVGLFLGGLAGTGTAGRVLAKRPGPPPQDQPALNEFDYFAALPAAAGEDDLFRNIAHESEVSEP